MTTVYIDKNKEEVIKACVKENKPCLLIGETGTGKTTIIRELAHMAGKELIRVSLNGSTSVEEIIGKWLAKEGSTFWQDGILTQAMKKGHWIVFDEINAALPEILFTLHSLLDDDRRIMIAEKDGEIVIPVEDFRFFATMNPTEEYAGTKEMNKALMSRFTAVVYVEVPSADIEMNILKDHGATPKEAQDLVQLAEQLRRHKKDENIYYFCSTRDLIHAVDLRKGGLDMSKAIHFAVFGKMSLLEFDVVKALATMSFVLPKTIEDIHAEAETIKKKATEELTKVATLAGVNKDLELKLNTEVESHKKTATKLAFAEKKVASFSRPDLKDIFKQLVSEME